MPIIKQLCLRPKSQPQALNLAPNSGPEETTRRWTLPIPKHHPIQLIWPRKRDSAPHAHGSTPTEPQSPTRPLSGRARLAAENQAKDDAHEGPAPSDTRHPSLVQTNGEYDLPSTPPSDPLAIQTGICSDAQKESSLSESHRATPTSHTEGPRTPAHPHPPLSDSQADDSQSIMLIRKRNPREERTPPSSQRNNPFVPNERPLPPNLSYSDSPHPYRNSSRPSTTDQPAPQNPAAKTNIDPPCLAPFSPPLTPLIDPLERDELRSQSIQSTQPPIPPDREAPARPVREPPASCAAFIESLHREPALEELALLYGLDMETLTTITAVPEDSSAKRLALAEIATLKTVRTHLIDRRARIKFCGESFVVPLVRIPTRILSIEKERLVALERKGKEKAHNYTNYHRNEIFRCPLPGCAGALVNIACIKPAMIAHCNAYRENPPMPFTFHVELARTWDVFTYPVRPENTSPIPTSDQDRSHRSHPDSQATNSNTNKNQLPPSVSALRLSLLSELKPANAPDQLTFNQEEDEELKGTGVYAFPQLAATTPHNTRDETQRTRGLGARPRNRKGDKPPPPK